MRIPATALLVALALCPPVAAQDGAAPSPSDMADSITGDATAGEGVFNQCRACHAADEEINRVGPHLVGLFGRPAGTVEAFNYSAAMTGSGIVWSPETLAAYLTDPRGFIPGNRMAFAGIRNADQLNDLIAYLFGVTAAD